MALPDGFPGKVPLEKAGYETVDDVKEATNVELIGIDGIAEGTLDKIRDVAPYTPSKDESGPGETVGMQEAFHTRTSKLAENIDPVTNQKLPDGIVRNERGTFTASSTVDQEDMFHPNKLEAERKARLRSMGEKISAALGE